MPTMPGTFRPPGAQSRDEQKREFDKRRGSARDRGYTSRWDRASRLFRRSHPLCLGCQAVGWVSATEVTDHIVPHRGDDRLFWDMDNWQPSCAWHHDVVKQKLERMLSHGEIDAEMLRLDSDIAKKITLRERGEGGGG